MAVKLLSDTNTVKKAADNKGYSGKPITENITNGYSRVNRK
jgi:hypothetical protein